MMDLERQLEAMREELNRLRQAPDENQLREMEQEGQALLRQTVGSALNAQAEALFTEILTVRHSTVTPAPQSTEVTAELDMLLRRARVRVKTASDPAEYRGALDFVRRVLDLEAETPEAYDLLEKLLGKAPDLQENAIILLTPLATHNSCAKEVLQRLSAPPSMGGDPSGAPRQPDFSPPPPQSQGTGISEGGVVSPTDLEELRRRMTDLYYQGEYREAINLCDKILEVSPYDEQAKDYRIKAEDYLNRGFVPDNRIPLQARMAYNRGNSAKRAGMYKEAIGLYYEALQLARMEGLGRWADAENSLMEIEDLALAKELTDEGDALSRQDRWKEAAERYEGALELSESPRTRKKYDAVNKLLDLCRQIDVRLATVSGSPPEIAQELIRYMNSLSSAREYFPDSERLAELNARVETRSQEISLLLLNQGRTLLKQAYETHALTERLHVLDSAQEFAEILGKLRASDAESDSLTQEVSAIQSETNSMLRLLAEAAKYDDLPQQQDFLTSYPYLVVYEEYQRLLRQVIGTLLAESVQMRDRSDFTEAEILYGQADSLYNFVRCIVESKDSLTQERLQNVQQYLEQQLARHRRELKFRRVTALVANQEYEPALLILDELLAENLSGQSFNYDSYRANLIQRREKHLNLKYHIERGRAHLANLDGDEAFSSLADALKLDPEDPTVKELYSQAVELRRSQKFGWRALSSKEKIMFVGNATLAFLLLVGIIYLLTTIL